MSEKDLLRARVIKSGKRVFDCKVCSSGEIIQATALRILIKKKNEHVVVGDYVHLKKESDEFVICEIEERTTEIKRFQPRINQNKTIASNCDLLVLIASVSKPSYSRGLLERYLIRANEWDLKPIIIFNKMDQFDGQFNLEEEINYFDFLDVETIKFSAIDSKFEKEVELVKSKLENKTCIFLGKSGVGKSKIITLLSEDQVELKSSGLAKVGKGAHTTTWAELITLEKFSLIDSPGIRSFSLSDIYIDDLLDYFPKLKELSLTCQFKDCTHSEKSKGCSFYLLDEDDQDTFFLKQRINTFLRIQDEVDSLPKWKKS